MDVSEKARRTFRTVSLLPRLAEVARRDGYPQPGEIVMKMRKRFFEQPAPGGRIGVQRQDRVDMHHGVKGLPAGRIFLSGTAPRPDRRPAPVFSLSGACAC